MVAPKLNFERVSPKGFRFILAPNSGSFPVLSTIFPEIEKVCDANLKLTPKIIIKQNCM